MKVLLEGESSVMITRQDQMIVPIPFDAILDPATGRTRIRMLDTSSLSYGTARLLQVRLEESDLETTIIADALCQTTGLSSEALRARYFEETP